jgi:signal transduction histidine kinase
VGGMGGHRPGVDVGELATTNAMLRSVIDGIADPVYAKDADGRYLLVNRAAERASGLRGEAVEIALFRVAQQALANVAEHAGATEVEVLEQPSAGCVVLRVTDDGCGFDPVTVARPGHGHRFGLSVMAERVEALGGHLAVRARRQGGTEVEARLPGPPSAEARRG